MKAYILSSKWWERKMQHLRLYLSPSLSSCSLFPSKILQQVATSTCIKVPQTETKSGLINCTESLNPTIITYYLGICPSKLAHLSHVYNMDKERTSTCVSTIWTNQNSEVTMSRSSHQHEPKTKQSSNILIKFNSHRKVLNSKLNKIHEEIYELTIKRTDL